MNKYLVKVYVPLLDSNYDIWIPKIYTYERCKNSQYVILYY